MDPRILPMSTPQLSEWLRWPTGRVARWIAASSQPVVMGWPFNGTRRWYLAYRRQNLNARDYLTTLTRRLAELHRMIFAHGVDTIVTPLFGPELLRRGSANTQYVLSGLSRLAEDEVYQGMFAAGVRIRFYGDYEEMLDAPIFRPTLEACKSLAAATASANGPTLLIGLFADSPHATLARLSVEFSQRWGRPPERRELIEAYYGLAVPDLSLYLGFAQPALFDIPLLATGQENLYVTLNPSPSLTEKQLREILYDHLVTRRMPEVDYDELSDEAQDALVEYYKHCSGVTMGIGRIDPLTGLWKPHPLAPAEGHHADQGVAS